MVFTVLNLKKIYNIFIILNQNIVVLFMQDLTFIFHFIIFGNSIILSCYLV